MRKLSKSQARKMQAERQTRAGGRPRKPRPCPKCGVPCPSTVAAIGPATTDAARALGTIKLSQFAPVLPYILMVLILIFRPRGLLGRRDT